MDAVFGSALDRIIRRARGRGARRFLVYWNRGLGDIALGVQPIFERIRSVIPDAEFSVVTREELREPFLLLDPAMIYVVPGLIRGSVVLPKQAFAAAGVDVSAYDVVMERPDPTRWLAKNDPPTSFKVHWKPEYDARAERFALRPGVSWVAAHVNTETARFYGQVKDWPTENWQQLLSALTARDNVGVVLLGHHADNAFQMPGVVDLRGKTTFLEALALIKCHCRVLIAPDSGILSMVFLLDATFPLTAVSLWGDPCQGIMKNALVSPDPEMQHIALVGTGKMAATIPVADVVGAVGRGLATV